MVPTWGPSGADRTQVGPMLGPMNFAIWVYILGWGLLNLHQLIFLLVIFLVLQKKTVGSFESLSYLTGVPSDVNVIFNRCFDHSEKIKEILTPLQVTAISASLRGIDLYFGNITKRHSPLPQNCKSLGYKYHQKIVFSFQTYFVDNDILLRIPATLFHMQMYIVMQCYTFPSEWHFISSLRNHIF